VKKTESNDDIINASPCSFSWWFAA
jgi:hypothetical protein